MNLEEVIESTNLNQTATIDDIIKLLDEAIFYHFPIVVVPPYYVESSADYLKESQVEVCTVVGFPNGYQTKEVKQYEAIDAIQNGAKEIDLMININALKNKDYDYIKEEIEMVRDAIDGRVLKIIIETSLLEEDEIKKMTEICNETFVHFIKTSTGFGQRGVTNLDLEIINRYKNDILEIKASGGIKTSKKALTLLKLGATRIGTSHAKEIVEEFHEFTKME